MEKKSGEQLEIEKTSPKEADRPKPEKVSAPETEKVIPSKQRSEVQNPLMHESY